MPTSKQYSKQFEAEQLRILAELEILQLKTLDEIIAFLRSALELITNQINAAPITEWEAWRLPKLQSEIKRILDELSQQLISTGNAASTAAWENGINRVIAPLTAIQPGVINPAMIALDATRLQAMKVFMTDRLADISASAVGKINAQLGLIAIGATDRHTAIANVTKLLEDGGKTRAKRIVDTELSRMSEVARHQAHTEAAKRIPGLQKIWRRSGKIHSRKTHDIADGQAVDVDKPFIVGGHEMMHPHDPTAPIDQVVNCGCKALMHMEGWNLTNQVKKPFSAEELMLSPGKREIANAKPVGEV